MIDTYSITEKIANRLKSLKNVVGNTPLIEINLRFKGRDRRIFAKLENINFTGSIKDRMALHILTKAYENNSIKPEATIVEATSGNTGISFSAIGKALGHKVTIFMPDWMSRERVELIQSLGAKVMPITKEQGGFLGSIRMTEEFAKSNENIFLPCQFANQANVEAHYLTTGQEIWYQLQTKSIIPDAFIAGVGTGGTIMGVGKYLREKNPKIKIHPLEPMESPTMSTGYKVGHHRIQGISDEFIPQIVDLKNLDKIIAVSDGDSIIMAQRLASQLGLAVGISSGANFIGALKIQDELGDDANVVTVFADDNKKYLSTDLLREEKIKPEYFSKDVELLGFDVIKRLCRVCCDPINCEQQNIKMN